MPLQHILVPVDLSESARAALLFAHALAQPAINGGQAAQLSVLHAYALKTESKFLSLSDINERERLAAQDARNRLEAFVQDTLGAAANVQLVVRMGFPIEEIIRLTDKLRFDLVVMGTKGATNLRDQVLGTNTVSVIRNVETPVLVVPRSASFAPMRDISVMADGGSNQPQQLQTLVGMAKTWGSHLTLTQKDLTDAAMLRSQIGYDQLDIAPYDGRDEFLDELEGIYDRRPQLLALSVSNKHMAQAFTILQDIGSGDTVPVLVLR